MYSKIITGVILLCAIGFSSCGQATKGGAWKGRLTYTYSGDIKTYEFAGKKEKIVMKEAFQPFVTRTGEIFFVNDAFPKKKVLVKKSNSSFTQFSNVLDLSSDNPQYKKALEEYSVINGTGISAILDHISDPQVSPNGKYLSVTIFGYPGQAFTKNCVAVFDVAGGQLVKQFDEKYYGNWLPDGRLMMSGAHKGGSVDDKLVVSAQPGIFIADATLANTSRIDDNLNDPAPYHATPSPDAKKVAFILNGHVWVMDIDGKNKKQLTDADNDNTETYPAWSSDGKNIACWSYKTFERNFYTAIAIVPANAAKPVPLTNNSTVWPRDAKGDRLSGGAFRVNWK